jgi:hypothetical protein
MARACRRYCQLAAVVFVVVTVYTVATKSIDGRLAHDWLHSVLHVGSATAAAYAGWGARGDRPAVLLTGFLAAVYLGLGVFGWFVDGLLLGTPLAIPLGPADNVFHLLVGGAATVVLGGTVVGSIRSRS